MPRYAMVIDVDRCVGCHACTVACNKEWDVPLGFGRTHVQSTGIVGKFPKLTSAFRVAQCNQCDRPSCVTACPTGATHQGEDGIVRIDRGLCIGCGYCVAACPYDARYINTAAGRADKCDFCSARLERGLQPACVNTCTAHAKYFGDIEDSNSEVFRMIYDKGAGRIQTKQVAIGPNVFYAGKPEQVELLAASFAPHPPRAASSSQFWTALLKPVILAGVGATFLGQAIAFFCQLATGEKSESHHATGEKS